jgi:hypothetical protein
VPPQRGHVSFCISGIFLAPIFRDNRRSHRRQRAIDWRLMEHRKETSLRAPLDWRGPGVSAVCCRMAGEIEDVDHAFPYGLTLECLADGDGSQERRVVTHFEIQSESPPKKGVGQLSCRGGSGFVQCSLADQHFMCGAECIEAGRDPAIGRRMQQGSFDLLDSNAIVERTFNVQLNLRRPV